MQLITTEGIVLDSKIYKERDRLVKIFTKEAGIQTVIVKNSVTPKSQYYHVVQPLVYSKFVLKVSDGRLGYINSVRDTEYFKYLQQDLLAKSYAVYFSKLVEIALNNSEIDSSVYLLYKTSLKLLDSKLDPKVISFIFELQMLKRFGVTPNFKCCSICGQKDMKIVYDYAPKYGGIVCYKHFDNQLLRYHAHPKAIYYVRKLLNVKLEDIQYIDLKLDTKRLIRDFIDQLYDDYVGISLKSRHFIDELEELDQSLFKSD